MDIVSTVKQTIIKHNLFKSGDNVLIGVSGGADSMTLLFILYELRYELGLKLLVLHVNHHLRKESSIDEIFVRNICNKIQIPFFNAAITVPRHKPGSLEEIAREKRFEKFIQIAKKKKCRCMALGHHLDDLAETVLMRILRGTGLLGLQGIQTARKFENVLFVRPLLEVRKKDILVFLKKKKITFRNDATNQHKRFFRNRIRLELIPLLNKSYNANIAQALSALANTTAQDYDYLWNETKKIYKTCVLKKTASSDCIYLKLKNLRHYHLSLIRMLIRMGLDHLKGDLRQLTLIHLKEIEDLIYSRPIGAAVHLPDGLIVTKEKDTLMLRKN